jgi:TrmH family RNA methyltransferase
VRKKPKVIKISRINRNQYCNFSKLAYRDTTEGILAVAKTKSMQLSDLNSENPLILIAEAPENWEYRGITAHC